jgi:hypothetical protein
LYLRAADRGRGFAEAKRDIDPLIGLHTPNILIAKY